MTDIFNVRREAPLTEADRPLCVYPLKNFDTTLVGDPTYGLEPQLNVIMLCILTFISYLKWLNSHQKMCGAERSHFLMDFNHLRYEMKVKIQSIMRSSHYLNCHSKPYYV